MTAATLLKYLLKIPKQRSKKKKKMEKKKANVISLTVKDNLLTDPRSQFLRIYKICSLKILAISITRIGFYFDFFSLLKKKIFDANKHLNVINLYSSSHT